MEAAVDCLTENLQIVNEALEGHSISDLKQNMAAESASLPENFDRVNAALEGLSISDLMRNMAATIPSLAENFKSVSEALEKAKKHLLLRVQNFDENIDEQRELSELIMHEVCDGRAEVEKVNYELNYLTKTLGKWVDKITEFDKKQEDKITELQKKKTLALMSVDDLVQSSEGNSTKAPELTQFSQEFRNAGMSHGLFPASENFHLQKAKEHLLQSFQNLAGQIYEQPELSKLVMNEVRDVAEVVKDDDKLKYLAERVLKTEDKINELRKKQTHALMGIDDLVQSSEEKSTKAPELTQFAQEFRNAGRSRGLLPSSKNLCLQKAKEHLLKNFEDLTGRIDQQPEFSKLIINRVRDEDEVVKDDDDLIFFEDTLSKIDAIVTDLKKNRTLTLTGVNDVVQSSEGKSTKALELHQFAQEIKNAGTSPCLHPCSAAIDLLEDRVAEFMKLEKAKKHFSQRVQNLGGTIAELEKKEKAKNDLSQSVQNLSLKIDSLN